MTPRNLGLAVVVALFSLAGVLAFGGPAENIVTSVPSQQPTHVQIMKAVEQLAVRPVLRTTSLDSEASLDAENPDKIGTVEFLEQQVQEDPDDVNTRKELVNAYTVERRYADALTALAELRRVAPDDPSVELSMSRVWFNLGEYREAREHARVSLEMETTAEALGLTGSALLAEGHAEAALPLLRAAVDLRSDESFMQAALGQALLKTGEWSLARHHLELALSMNPSSAQVWTDLAFVAAQLGKWDYSLQLYQQVHSQTEALNQLGVALLSQGRWEEAGHFFQQALKLDPGHADARFNLFEAESYQPLPSVVTLSGSGTRGQSFRGGK